MQFLSMVAFMVKWAFAAIPAFLILMFLGGLAWTAGMGFLLATTLRPRPTTTAAAPPEAGPSAARSPQAGVESPENTAAYLSKVIVKGAHVAEASLGGRGAFGEVKNNGDRSLSKVQITIYCLDQSGRRIFEKQYYPVLVTSMSFGADKVPLKPGYSRQFGVRLDDAPSEWSGKVDVVVTEIEFERPPQQ